MLVDKQSELMSDLLFTVHQHGGDDVTWKPPIWQNKGKIPLTERLLVAFKDNPTGSQKYLSKNSRIWGITPRKPAHGSTMTIQILIFSLSPLRLYHDIPFQRSCGLSAVSATRRHIGKREDPGNDDARDFLDMIWLVSAPQHGRCDVTCKPAVQDFYLQLAATVFCFVLTLWR